MSLCVGGSDDNGGMRLGEGGGVFKTQKKAPLGRSKCIPDAAAPAVSAVETIFRAS